MRIFLLCLLFTRLCADSIDDLVPTSSEEIASLNTELLIGGYVSALSGQLSIHEQDLHIHAAQDLQLTRSYLPPQVLGRYEDKERRDRYFLAQDLQQKRRAWAIVPHLYSGYNANSRHLLISDPQGIVLPFQIEKGRGVLMLPQYGMSNLSGEEPSSAADLRNTTLLVKDGTLQLTTPDGTERHYKDTKRGIFRLDMELLPNGKAIRYQYHPSGALAKILSTDVSGNYVYASIERQDSDHYIGSDQTKASYTYKEQTITGEYHNTTLTTKKQLLSKAATTTYTHSVAYDDRCCLSSYDAQHYPISCTYSRPKNAVARVETLKTPSNCTSFSYDPPVAGKKSGKTTVTYADGAEKVYRFNKMLLLEAVENWLEKKLINQKIFTYNSKQQIKRIETRDGEQNLLIAKHYECDDAGNPLLETIEADCGTFSIRRTFDNNRLTSEDRDDGLQHIYTYLGNSRLLTTKITLESGKELRKTVYHYDNAKNLIQEDQVGKTKTDYTLYQTAPHLHQVEWKEQRDWEDHLIHKTHYLYDQWNNVAQEEHFGSDGIAAYTIQRTYNEKRELLTETNPLGERATYAYTKRGRCNYEVPFANQLVINRTFDDKGRLLLLKEGDHKTSFNYNSSDELIEKTDYLGYTTKYHYHPVHSNPDRIEEPNAITQISYDPFGRAKERIDPYGAKTQTSHNSYGDIAKIIHPNGGVETFSYTPNGLLANHVDPDGLQTTYARDPLARLREKTVGDQTTLFYYDAYDLYKTVDPAGFITEYKHDLVGRKIAERRQGRLTQYGYDPLGFLAWQTKGNRRIDYIHNPLGQLLTKSIDHVLETVWTYDAGENIATVEQGAPLLIPRQRAAALCKPIRVARELAPLPGSEGQSPSITSYTHDCYNRLIEKIDPEGHRTTICYEERPQLLLKKIRDPNGIETIESYNPQGQLLKREVSGQVVEERSYDKTFRLSSQDQLTFGYTLNGEREWVQDAGERTTSWLYTPGNRVQTKKKPDGTELIYGYDSQWRLAKVGRREFRYDELDRIIGGTGFARELDAFGNITREEWINGLWIESDYDDWDRPLERRLPDQSCITYEYEGPFLWKVTRISKTGESLYSHTYDEHDARGNPWLEVGPFTTAYEYDKSGRRINLQSPYFQESVAYDPAGNLIRKGDTTYTYDNLSQMTSESGHFTAKYDAHYNLREFNGVPTEVNALNQIQGMAYDLNGNLARAGFVYDEFDVLVEAGGEKSLYDALGRRMQRGATSFLYVGNEEIGAFKRGEAEELKIPGLGAPVAIEVRGKPYAPITDAQGTIRLLVDWKSGKVAQQNGCDAFGAGLSGEIPYAYAGKRYDPKTGLVYFGQRYYDPSIRRWLTPDPLGPVDHSNLYQYVFNNPYRFRDPNGESIGGYLLGLGEILLGGTMMIGGLGLELITCGGFTIGFGVVEGAGIALIGHGLSLTTQHAQDIRTSTTSWKNTNPFEGPVDGEIFVGDAAGNIIPVPVDHQVEGTRNGQWIQVKDKDGVATGTRKDGGGHPREKDIRGREPHAHVPETSNLDGTPWLPIYY